MAKNRKPNGVLEQLMDIMIEITDYSWKFAAVASAVFLFLSGFAYRWAYAYNHPIDKGSIAVAFADSLGWLVYIIPLMLFIFACMFAWRAFVTFSKENDY